MRIPFHDEFDDVFRGDRSIWWKMGGCAVATAFVVVSFALRGNRRGQLDLPMSPPVLVGLALGSAAAGALLGLALSLKDVVRGRVARGEPVNPLLRLYFGMGAWSLVAWSPTVIVVAFLVTMATLS